MVSIADSRRRVTLPKGAEPGEAFSVEEIEKGKFLVTRLEMPARTARTVKLTREKGFLVASTDRPITMEQTRALMDEFP